MIGTKIFLFVTACVATLNVAWSFTGVGTARRATAAPLIDDSHSQFQVQAHTKQLSELRRGQLAKLHSANGAGESDGNGFFDGLQLNPPFIVAFVGFLTFAYFRTVGEGPGASQDVLNLFLADPIHPRVNELFAVVFNLLGLVAFPMACLIMPSAGAKEQKLPAPPFLMASAFAGFGGLGPYMMVRKPVTTVAQSDLGWFTKNVLENKAFNWLIVASALSTLFVTGFVPAFLSDPGQTVQGYSDLFSNTAIVSASSVDLAILTLTMASLVQEDLKRRGVQDEGKAKAIAASTVLLPVIGGSLYCALRPNLPEE